MNRESDIYPGMFLSCKSKEIMSFASIEIEVESILGEISLTPKEKCHKFSFTFGT
jgi:hypothetical protein